MRSVKLLDPGSTPLARLLNVCSRCTGQPHRALVFSSQRGRAEALPGPGTSHTAELAMSRPDVSPESLSPSAEALGATQPSAALEQPLPGEAEAVSLEQVVSNLFIPVMLLNLARVWEGDSLSYLGVGLMLASSCRQVVRLTPCPSAVLGQWRAWTHLGAQASQASSLLVICLAGSRCLGSQRT